VDSVGKARAPFGKLESRKLLGAKLLHEAPGAPPGDYVVMQYEAKFPGQTAVETITPMRDGDAWRVSGYYVRSGKRSGTPKPAPGNRPASSPPRRYRIAATIASSSSRPSARFAAIA